MSDSVKEKRAKETFERIQNLVTQLYVEVEAAQKQDFWEFGDELALGQLQNALRPFTNQS